MSDKDVELLLKYPLTEIIIEADNIIYKGLIDIEENHYNFRLIKTKSDPYKLKITSDLLPFKEELTRIKFSSSDNVIAIFEQIKGILSKTKFNIKNTVEDVEIYRRVLYEFSEFTRFYINLNKCSLSCDLRSIFIIALDEQNRRHNLNININYNENQNIFHVEKCVLPIKDCTKFLSSKYSTLTELYREFQTYLEFFQEFWNLMDLFDNYSNVIDPEVPMRSDCYRRIKINDNVSIIVTVDPFNVNSMPDIKFLGPQKLVEKYRHKLSKNLEDFYQQKNIFKWILELLELDSFPQKQFEKTSESNLLKYDGECSICFSLRLEDKLPEVICQNLSCENLYHVKCLYEWLMSVNSCRLFNEVAGECPNCERNILCPIPT